MYYNNNDKKNIKNKNNKWMYTSKYKYNTKTITIIMQIVENNKII